MGPRAGLDRCGKSRPTGIRYPDRPARSQSLYRLRYPAHIRSPDRPARTDCATRPTLRSVEDNIFTHCKISDSVWDVGEFKTERQVTQCFERNHLPVSVCSLQFSHELFWSRTPTSQVKFSDLSYEVAAKRAEVALCEYKPNDIKKNSARTKGKQNVNPFKTKCVRVILRTQSVPRCKHTPPRL